MLLSLVLVALLALLLLGVVAAVVRAVHHDGYGLRPPPRSHLPWDGPPPTSWP
ncbi:hypothetical protein J4G33_03635 [Actinotalea sp. BY-33]|uniref:Uncharacterized protein n=1 Tax=Actinotalea soli TaxID=2819234 RepID=A0A939LT70_9CELL|nr:hypothetical protein [Actinotalea soli]MBO1750887.1 hypothetical protein [Actinotalea soli]